MLRELQSGDEAIGRFAGHCRPRGNHHFPLLRLQSRRFGSHLGRSVGGPIFNFIRQKQIGLKSGTARSNGAGTTIRCPLDANPANRHAETFTNEQY
jgi:hypothetical protein